MIKAPNHRNTAPTGLPKQQSDSDKGHLRNFFSRVERSRVNRSPSEHQLSLIRCEDILHLWSLRQEA